MQKWTRLLPAIAMGLLCSQAVLAQQAPQQSAQPAAAPVAAAGGLEAVTPFIGANTDLVVAVDLGNVNVDQVRTWMQNQMQKAGVDKATMDKMQAESKAEMDKATQWLTQFKQAGGRRIYVVASFQDFMSGTGPLVIVPVEGQADGKALAKVFEADMAGAGGAGAGPDGAAPGAGEQKPVAAMAGRNLLIGTRQAVDAAKTPQTAARPDLMQALGATATLKVAVSGANAGKAGNVAGMPVPPQAQGIEWISFNMNAPPAVGASLTVQAKDAQTAQNLVQMINEGLAAMQQHPQVQQALGNNVGALTQALTPKTNNRRITVALNKRTIEDTLMPAAIKAGVARMQQAGAQPPAEGAAPPPQPGL